MKFKVVEGYKAATETHIAMERGEVDGRCGISWDTLQALNADWLRDGKIRILIGSSETMGTGIKVGLRLPWLYYVARTIRLDRAFVVRRGLPGLAFAVRNQDPLRSVLVSTPQAQELAAALARDRR